MFDSVTRAKRLISLTFANMRFGETSVPSANPSSLRRARTRSSAASAVMPAWPYSTVPPSASISRTASSASSRDVFVAKRVEVRDLSERAVVKLATERKHLTDIIKMVAYQAESDLKLVQGAAPGRQRDDGFDDADPFRPLSVGGARRHRGCDDISNQPT
jgi:hypothetical protein